jgi:hypothetical protein
MLSLLELRRHMLRRSGELGVRARRQRARGDVVGAARSFQESARLRRTAEDIQVRPKP